MGTRTNPFHAGAPPDRERLERYVQGALSPQERHEVEAHLESDPLLREATEGLLLPGAMDAMYTLHGPPTGRSPLNWRLMLVAVAGVGAALVWTFTRPTGEAPLPAHAPISHAAPAGPMSAAVESSLLVVDAELEAHPVEPQITWEPAAERFRSDPVLPGPMERTGVDRMPARTPRVGQHPATPDLLHDHAGRPSRRLIFLHGMKVVHPAELDHGMRDLPSPGRSAHAEAALKDSIPASLELRPYLVLMDHALNALAQGGERTALEDLYLLLGQRPHDVNAQFYAGLACYRLGLYARAQGHFKAAATNSVNSFREEALWYQALTTEHTAGFAAAQPLFERIGHEGGFYAHQAHERLQQTR